MLSPRQSYAGALRSPGHGSSGASRLSQSAAPGFSSQHQSLNQHVGQHQGDTNGGSSQAYAGGGNDTGPSNAAKQSMGLPDATVALNTPLSLELLNVLEQAQKEIRTNKDVNPSVLVRQSLVLAQKHLGEKIASAHQAETEYREKVAELHRKDKKKSGGMPGLQELGRMFSPGKSSAKSLSKK